MKISFWVIWMDSKSNNVCPQKRKAEGHLRQTDEEKNSRGQGHMKKNEGRDWSNANTGCNRQEAEFPLEPQERVIP